MGAQRLREAIDEFGGQPHCHTVLGEDDMLEGILEFYLYSCLGPQRLPV
jgi:hypothetical protein